MKKMFLMALTVAMMAGLSATTAFAQRDAGAKVRGDFGHGFWHHNSTMMSRATFNYQAAPVLESNRSFSYEPTTNAPAPKPTVQTDNTAKATNPAPVVNNRTTRRFSYEPTPMVRSYNSVQSHKSPWQYPKTDPRRYHH
ncbi:hypothetical protein M4951_19925 [Blastopirellula sp. J2-11]|uniref:hypothetical protein n=1 Tax=Blastopirellula sp. J2-11 TaxID=2943192 RepID=UPI0021C8D848|nr:hypothetical protein [Blastopirellula sp. J2-11]UUO05631.1 hypothetical protein M4951_19925 [Blastopirellula sp. J2-11]